MDSDSLFIELELGLDAQLGQVRVDLLVAHRLECLDQLVCVSLIFALHVLEVVGERET